uniref:Uncharacterized protein n=1 Tax=Bradyrhizobium ottawaense TaxID=931866 RepID=A0A2U8PHN9_9BRAD|nr:hypothetical protein CIT37_38105 [Bradyrhizobium ottawaense]
MRVLTAGPPGFLFDVTGICDLPARRHAQASRPDHQGRSMSSFPNLIRQIVIFHSCAAAAPKRVGVVPSRRAENDPGAGDARRMSCGQRSSFTPSSFWRSPAGCRAHAL